jgi:cytochrome b
MPDLARRARGSVGRLATALAGKDPVSAGDWLLAGYSILNCIVAIGLLAGAGFLWYQLFGGLARDLIHDGPPGWLALVAAAAILARPAISAAAPMLIATARGGRALYQAIAFRLQWRWRIPATRELAATVPQLAGLSDHQLGVLAGHLRRTRPRGSNLEHLTGYGIVQTGAVIATTAGCALVALTAGETWDPHHQLQRTISRATVLISVHAAAIEQLLCASDGDVSACS